MKIEYIELPPSHGGELFNATQMRGYAQDMVLLNLPTQFGPDFQQRVHPWVLQCFGNVVAYDTKEHNYRFLEEALELVQAAGATKQEALDLVDYVYGRPVGELSQEVGGVMVTLAALCLANSVSMHEAGETELARVKTPEMIARIQAKNASKPKFGSLPGADVRLADNHLGYEIQVHTKDKGWISFHPNKDGSPYNHGTKEQADKAFKEIAVMAGIELRVYPILG